MEMDRVGWKGKWWSWKRNKGMEGREKKASNQKGGLESSGLILAHSPSFNPLRHPGIHFAFNLKLI